MRETTTREESFGMYLSLGDGMHEYHVGSMECGPALKINSRENGHHFMVNIQALHFAYREVMFINFSIRIKFF